MLIFQNGIDCYCGNDEIRGEFAELNMTITDDDLEEECKLDCPGDDQEQCGGMQTSALYTVPEGLFLTIKEVFWMIG